MMKHEFYYTSRDSVTKIHAIEWLPDRDIKGVLQICHGMVEYIDRYDEFAEFMSEHGYYVVGHDHLGHGKSIQTEADLGYFDERKGNQYVIGDIYQLQEMTRKKYPDVPYFMLGHSMGSFLLRQYLTMYAEGLAGVVIMGTGHQGMLTLCAGTAVFLYIYTGSLLSDVCRYEGSGTERKYETDSEDASGALYGRIR